MTDGKASIRDYIVFLMLVGGIGGVGMWFGYGMGIKDEHVHAVEAGVGEYLAKDGELVFQYKKQFIPTPVIPPQPTPAPVKPPGKPPGATPGTIFVPDDKSPPASVFKPIGRVITGGNV